MRYFFGCLLLATLAVAGAEKAPTLAQAKNQFELNQAAAKEASDAEAELNRVYQQVSARNQGDPAFVRKFREAQQAWMKYREAQLESCWPDNDRRGYGSVHPMCRSLERARITRARVEELKRFLERTEGDVCACAGS